MSVRDFSRFPGYIDRSFLYSVQLESCRGELRTICSSMWAITEDVSYNKTINYNFVVGVDVCVCCMFTALSCVHCQKTTMGRQVSNFLVTVKIRGDTYNEGGEWYTGILIMRAGSGCRQIFSYYMLLMLFQLKFLNQGRWCAHNWLANLHRRMSLVVNCKPLICVFSCVFLTTLFSIIFSWTLQIRLFEPVRVVGRSEVDFLQYSYFDSVPYTSPVDGGNIVLYSKSAPSCWQETYEETTQGFHHWFE